MAKELMFDKDICIFSLSFFRDKLRDIHEKLGDEDHDWPANFTEYERFLVQIAIHFAGNKSLKRGNIGASEQYFAEGRKWEKID